jgi:hypothetical protein
VDLDGKLATLVVQAILIRAASYALGEHGSGLTVLPGSIKKRREEQ